MSQTDVVKTTPILSDDQLGDIKSFDDAIALLAQAGIEVASVTELGDGFDVHDKDEFVKVPFVVLETKIIDADKSDHGSPFVVLRLMTKDGRKAIVTDGSTGVCKQVISLDQRGISLVGRYCEKGFERSDYDYVDSGGDKRPASTFYIHGL